MRIGRLKDYVEIQQKVMVEDANLEWVESWPTFTHCWASIEPLIGREYYASKTVNSEVSAKIRIRYIAGVKTTMKVIDGTKIYDIEAVINIDNKNEELVLLVKEVI